MKSTKLFFAFLAIVTFCSPIFAQNGNSGQNGNAVISEVKIYDNGNGTGLVEVRVCGNPGSPVTGGYFYSPSLSRMGAGALTVSSPGNSQGNGVILTGMITLAPAVGNEPEFIELDIEIVGLTWRGRYCDHNQNAPRCRIYK